MTPRPFQHIAGPLLLPLFLCAASAGQTTHFASNPTRLVCDHGEGAFHGALPADVPGHDVEISVGPTRQRNGFATRTCQATLSWGDNQLVVTPDAVQADIDVMGADLGLGTPVIALQIKASDDDPSVQYKIYSLTDTPRLLRTITGHDYFSAADTRLDGHVEIWTTDAAAVHGFEDLPRRAFDSAPAMILRFQDGKLIDVSSEFRSYYDHQIEHLRSQLNPDQLSAFQKSDGRLSNESLPAGTRPQGLLAAKVKVLEIVWAYLYSSREQEAWQALSSMWPEADQDRIKAFILAAQARGLRAQVDSVSQHPTQAPSKPVPIYADIRPGNDQDQTPEMQATLADTTPRRIVWMTARSHVPADWSKPQELQLVIDEAGKVRSVTLRNVKSQKKKDQSRQEWLNSAAGWKCIPAFKDGKPVAYRWERQVWRSR